MSIKFKIPLIMLVAFLLNIIMLLLYYKVYLYNKVEWYQQNMDQTVSAAADDIAAAIDGQSLTYATDWLDSYENSKNLVLTLKNVQDGEALVWNGDSSHRFGFSNVKLVNLSEQPYIIQVQKKIELVNLNSNSLISHLLYFEIIIQFGMFLLVGLIIHFRYVTVLMKLDAKMKRYRSGDIIDMPVRSRDEIGQLQASFAELSQTLYEEKQTQNRIIASISHDIKTPLTSVLGYSERIASKQLSTERQKQYMQIIYNQAKDIASIVDEFDDYLSTTVTGAAQSQNYEVSYLCSMLEDEYSIQLGEQGIILIVNNSCKEGTLVHVDLLKLRRVFSNIIANSLRHAGVEDLIIGVSAMAENNRVVFTLADNGHGISAADFPHIFEPFYTSDKSRRVSGLGLSICRQIVEGLGGTIEARNNVMGGLSVLVSLPISAY